MNLRQRLVNNTKDKPIRQVSNFTKKKLFIFQIFNFTRKKIIICLQDELLDGLPLWLDRLFEGSTMRYYISTWPEFPVYKGNIGKGNQQQQPKKHMHEE